MHNKKIQWITYTASFIALLVIAQLVTAPASNIFLTGSLVNLLLIVSVMTCGLGTGVTVAAVSPILAKLIGIGPFWILIPFIATGNLVLVLVWHFLGAHKGKHDRITRFITVFAAAGAKGLVLYLGIVKLAVPVFLGLPEPQGAIISQMFSIPQFITASIGGLLAVVILPTLKKAKRLP